MKKPVRLGAMLSALILAGIATSPAHADDDWGQPGHGIRHVLLISVDGMHAVDFANCAAGLPSVNGGAPYCPNLAALAQHGVSYRQAATTRPSDSFPGLISLITGATPRTTGTFYDVSYDRSLSPPAKTTPYGIVGGAGLCPGTLGTQVGYDEEIDVDLTQLNGGGGIDPDYLPRDPAHGCAPVYPHTFIRVNTIFEVVKQSGGYTAWSDKHPSYDFTNGKSGKGVDDLYSPEINSIPVALPQVKLAACSPLPDQTAVSSSNAWTDSFANIQCYDDLKVQAVLNEINGRSSDGSKKRPTPTLFGMNFQAVSVGQKLVESSISATGGYLDAIGTPSPSLLGEIEYVDQSLGLFVAGLNAQHLLENTLVIVTAKHGQSPIDPNRVARIPHDLPSDSPPSAILSPAGVGPGFPVAQADEDDISMLWLSPNDPATVSSAIATLEASAASTGLAGGELYSGPYLDLLFASTATDPRTPDIIVAPYVGVTYTGGGGKVAEHGGFAQDDRNVLLVVSNPALSERFVESPVSTTQVAPTILRSLGLDPGALDGVRSEHTPVLPGLELP